MLLTFLQAIESLISIIIMVLLGYLLTVKGWFNDQNSALLPKLVNFVALPTYMIWNLMSTFQKDTFLPMVTGVVVPMGSMLLSYGISYGLSKLFRIEQKHQGTFRSLFFCSSSVFIGVPVNLALFGEKSLPYVLIYFLANAFLFWTIGNYSISLDGKAAPTKLISLATLKRVCSPPFMGFSLAVFLILLEVHLPDFIMSTSKYLGAMTTPLSMLFIGISMFGVEFRKIRLNKDMVLLLAGRFIISPLAVLLVAYFVPIPEIMKKVFVIQAALPAMSQATVLARIYEADTEYAALLVSVTTLCAVIAIPIYMAII